MNPQTLTFGLNHISSAEGLRGSSLMSVLILCLLPQSHGLPRWLRTHSHAVSARFVQVMMRIVLCKEKKPWCTLGKSLHIGSVESLTFPDWFPIAQVMNMIMEVWWLCQSRLNEVTWNLLWKRAWLRLLRRQGWTKHSQIRFQVSDTSRKPHSKL